MSLQSLKKKFFKTKQTLSMNEALGDMDRYMNDEMISYFKKVLSNPKDKANYLKAVARYDKLAKNASNRQDALYYEYRMYLPEAQALALAREFYQKETRNNVVSIEPEFENDDESGDKGYAQSLAYSEDLIDMGMFSGLRNEDPEESYEIKDFFDKVINNPKLDHFDRLVLLTNLYLGTGPNSKVKKSSQFSGVDLTEIMSNVPKEWNEILDQVKNIEMDANEPHPTADKILYGVSPNNTKSGKGIARLLSNSQKAKSVEKIKKSIKSLTGGDDYDAVAEWMFSINEDKTATQRVQEAIGRNKLLAVLTNYLEGNPVKKYELLALISQAINANLECRTVLSRRSPVFKNDFKGIYRHYKKLVNSKKESDIISIQTLIMAPVIEKRVNPKLKKLFR